MKLFRLIFLFFASFARGDDSGSVDKTIHVIKENFIRIYVVKILNVMSHVMEIKMRIKLFPHSMECKLSFIFHIAPIFGRTMRRLHSKFSHQDYTKWIWIRKKLFIFRTIAILPFAKRSWHINMTAWYDNFMP